MSVNPKTFKSGFAALMGKPNAGKSTLLNYVLREKVSIVSAKPQTTRTTLRGILTTDEYQIIFIDTPGVHRARNALGDYMVSAAADAGREADVILFLLDAVTGITPEDEYLFELFAKTMNLPDKWAAVVINKIDRVDAKAVQDLQRACEAHTACRQFFPVCAVDGRGVEKLLEAVIARLPAGPAYYPEDDLTDRNERFIAAELIREQALLFCREEIPHAVAVKVEAFKDNPGRKTLIQAVIFVERASQKKIIIGRQGTMLKEIGKASRLAIEKFLGRGVYLELWVKVRENWRRNEQFLRELGYTRAP